MRRAAAIMLILVLAAGGAGAWAAGRLLTGLVEARSAASLRGALQAAGLDWARVEVDGFAVRITGTAPDAARRAAALDLAARIVEPGRITGDIALAAAPPAAPGPARPPSLVILREGNAVSLSGRVPAGDDPATFARALAAIGPDLALSDALERTPGAPPPHWAALRDAALGAAVALRRAQIDIDGCRMRVTGLAADSARRDRLLARLAAAPCPVEAEILVPRPLVSPYVFALSLEGDRGRLFSCTAPGPAEIARIRTALEGVALEGGFACREGLGAPSASWTDAVVAAIGTLRGLGGGTLSLTDIELRLEALPGTPPARQHAALEGLRAALPRGFSLAPVPLPPESAPAPAAPAAPAEPQFKARRAAGDGVTLAGPLGSEAALTAVAAYAAAHFGSQADGTGLAIRPGLPEGWTARVMAALDALAQLEGGEVTLTGSRIALAGWSRDPAAPAAVRGILARVSEPGDPVRVEILRAPPPPPAHAEPPPPDPAECLARIEAILAAEQIRFASGSVRIEPESLPVVDRIAEVMRGCAPARFEIGGHTDDSGPAEGNLALSRGRAEAVVDALIARGVDLDRLVARGYGESMPVADNATEAGRALNRRIGVRLVEEADDGQ